MSVRSTSWRAYSPHRDATTDAVARARSRAWLDLGYRLTRGLAGCTCLDRLATGHCPHRRYDCYWRGGSYRDHIAGGWRLPGARRMGALTFQPDHGDTEQELDLLEETLPRGLTYVVDVARSWHYPEHTTLIVVTRRAST